MTETTQPTGAEVALFDVTEAQLQEWRELYADVPDATTKEGMEVIKSTLSELRGAAAGINKRAEFKTKEINAAKASMQAEGARIVAEIRAIIEPHAAAKKAVDDVKKLEKEEKERKARELVEANLVKIRSLRARRDETRGATLEEIKALLDEVQSVDITEEEFGTQFNLATETWANAVRGIKEDYDREKLNADARADREELAKATAVLQAENDRLRAASAPAVGESAPPPPPPPVQENTNEWGTTRQVVQIVPDAPKEPPAELICATNLQGGPVDITRGLILAMVEDCVKDLLFYDRKEDEDCPLGAIESAIAANLLTIGDIQERFALSLVEHLGE